MQDRFPTSRNIFMMVLKDGDSVITPIILERKLIKVRTLNDSKTHMIFDTNQKVPNSCIPTTQLTGLFLVFMGHKFLTSDESLTHHNFEPLKKVTNSSIPIPQTTLCSL